MFWFLKQTDICTLLSAIWLGGIQIFFGSDWDTFMEFRRAALDVGEIILYSSLHLCPPLFSYLLRPSLAWLTLRISFPVSGHTHIIDSPLGWMEGKWNTRRNSVTGTKMETVESLDLGYSPDHIHSLPYHTFFYTQTGISSSFFCIALARMEDGGGVSCCSECDTAELISSF